MNKITLSRALKERKRIIGRINNYTSEIIRNNIYEEENKDIGHKSNKIDIIDIYKKREFEIEKLLELKIKIGKANAVSGILDLVCEMEELKDLIHFYDKLPYEANSYVETIGDKSVYIERKAQINREDIINKKLEIQSRIERLQDEIDEKNATVKIDFDIE